MSCVCHAFASVHCCLVVIGGERADLWALVCDGYCDFVTYPFVILGQVWYLSVAIPDSCCLSYFLHHYKNALYKRSFLMFPIAKFCLSSPTPLTIYPLFPLNTCLWFLMSLLPACTRSTCADTDSFVRGGPTLKMFFFLLFR